MHAGSSLSVGRVREARMGTDKVGRGKLDEYGWISVFLGITSILAGGFALLVLNLHASGILIRDYQYPAYGLTLAGFGWEIARITRQPALRVATVGLVLNSQALALYVLSGLGRYSDGFSGVTLLKAVATLVMLYVGTRLVSSAARRDAVNRLLDLVEERDRATDEFRSNA